MRQHALSPPNEAQSPNASWNNENETTETQQSSIGLLVISDDPGLRQMLEPKLEAFGVEPRWATTYDEAINGTRGIWSPEAVLLDLLVPRAERYGICREIRAALGALVIMVDEPQPGIEHGALVADFFLDKPVTAEAVWASVHAVLSRNDDIDREKR